MVTEENCEMEETLNNDTPSIVSLDTGSTFNSTKNKNALTKTVEAKSPITSKTNVGKRLKDKHGMIPGPTWTECGWTRC